MITLIVGTQGYGKTKALISLINEAAKNTNGNVVCIEKGLKLTYDIDYSVRLVDIEQFDISGFDAFYGFIAGILAGNYDITHIFIDATFKIGGRDIPGLEAMILKLEKLLDFHGAEITFTVSCDVSELPEDIKKYIIKQ